MHHDVHAVLLLGVTTILDRKCCYVLQPTCETLQYHLLCTNLNLVPYKIVLKHTLVLYIVLI